MKQRGFHARPVRLCPIPLRPGGAHAVAPGAFAGATLRGGFGHAVKRPVCLWQPGECPRCLLRYRCVSPYVFETTPPPGGEKLRGISQIPRPYIIEANAGVAQTVAAGERCDFALVLIGRAIDDFPYFILAPLPISAKRGSARMARGLSLPRSMPRGRGGRRACIPRRMGCAMRIGSASRRQRWWPTHAQRRRDGGWRSSS